MELIHKNTNKPKGFAIGSKVDWINRLEICINQLELSITTNDNGIEYWLKAGFEASENCQNIIDTQGLDPKNIDFIKLKINNFNLTCKNDKIIN